MVTPLRNLAKPKSTPELIQYMRKQFERRDNMSLYRGHCSAHNLDAINEITNRLEIKNNREKQLTIKG